MSGTDLPLGLLDLAPPPLPLWYPDGRSALFSKPGARRPPLLTRRTRDLTSPQVSPADP